jgi:phosphoglycerol transferase MdoB-like AlkP superfamily enzyme
LAGIGLIVVVDLVLYVYALGDLYRRPVNQLTIANKWIWVAIILLVSTFGAIIYLLAGRKPAASADASSRGATPERAENAADALYGAPKGIDPR